MAPLARSLVAFACASLLSHANGNVLALDVRSLDLLAPTLLPGAGELPALALVQNCSILRIGAKKDGLRVVSYNDEMGYFTAKDAPLLLPKAADFGILKGAKITACNPSGPPPFLIANDGDNVSGQLHCSFMEKPEFWTKNVLQNTSSPPTLCVQQMTRNSSSPFLTYRNKMNRL